MAVVEFVYADWKALYPQFDTTVTQQQAVNCFATATLYCSNDSCAVVPYDPAASPAITARLQILYLLTAHVAQLQYGCVMGGTIVPAGPLVGRVSEAREGSVAIKTEMNAPQAAAWFMQTQWGAMAWNAMAPYRVGRYIASPGRYAFAGAPFPWPNNGRGRVGW